MASNTGQNGQDADKIQVQDVNKGEGRTSLMLEGKRSVIKI